MALGWYVGLASDGTMKLLRATDTSAGAADANKIPRLDSTGRLSSTVLPSTVGGFSAAITATEALTAGQVVSIHNSSGPRVRRADASNSRFAHGFVTASFSNGDTATVYGSGQEITGLTGLTPGADYILSWTTAGAIVLASTFTAAVNRTYQYIGFATSSNSLLFLPGQPLVCV